MPLLTIITNLGMGGSEFVAATPWTEQADVITSYTIQTDAVTTWTEQADNSTTWTEE